MTIIVVLKVLDGIVMAADSAGTQQDGAGILNVSENAEKLFNLCDGIGVVYCGTGTVGRYSVPTLIKEFKRRTNINPSDYTVQDVATKFKEFVFDDVYKNSKENRLHNQAFAIAGYSPKTNTAEGYNILIENQNCHFNRTFEGDDFYVFVDGMNDPVVRLIYCFDSSFESKLKKTGLVNAKIKTIIDSVTNNWSTDLINGRTSLADAADFAYFLVELTKKYYHFKPGFAQVGGPTQLAVITPYEGFRWVKHKTWLEEISV